MVGLKFHLILFLLHQNDWKIASIEQKKLRVSLLRFSVIRLVMDDNNIFLVACWSWSYMTKVSHLVFLFTFCYLYFIGCLRFLVYFTAFYFAKKTEKQVKTINRRKMYRHLTANIVNQPQTLWRTPQTL